MNEITIFEKQEFGKIRCVTLNNQPWFVGKDVADILGYGNSRDALAKHVDEDDKGVAKCDTLGGTQNLVVINESGLYSLILSSKLPNAKRFKHWVTAEVLPSIRKHGLYATDELLSDPEFAIRVFTALKEERAQRKALELKNAEMLPKVQFADAVSASKTSILVGEMAKILKQNGVDMGQNRFFDWLRKNGYLMQSGTSKNLPTQRSMDMGLFEIRESTQVLSDGSVRINKTPKILPKGQIYFVNKFLGSK